MKLGRGRDAALALAGMGMALLVGCRGPSAGPARSGGPAAAADAGAAAVVAPVQSAAPPPPLDAGAPVSADVAAPPADGGGGAAAGGDGCRSDADCTLTRRSAEDCCPTLCTPRALSTAADARQRAACAHVPEEHCAQPVCPRPPGAPRAVCRAGSCEVEFSSVE